MSNNDIEDESELVFDSILATNAGEFVLDVH